ncbi:hypothetical protein SEA_SCHADENFREUDE_58 [Mycobacterium phage Schadenfreude]|nr:hypothetical protein SEA_SCHADENFREUDE_58 [Mycobacterium phage Schadenfreude]
MSENCQHYYGNDGSGWLTRRRPHRQISPADLREPLDVGSSRVVAPHP